MSDRIVELAVDPSTLVPDYVFRTNIESAFERNFPRLFTYSDKSIFDKTKCMIEISSDLPAILVAGGPSLHDEIDKLKLIKGDIFGCGTNHDFLIDNGIIPKYHVICDPGPETPSFIRKPNRDIIYLMSSSCAPETFDVIEKAGCQIYLWHSKFTKDDEDIMIADYHNEPSVRVGGSVLLAAFPLAYIAGYRKYHFFGFDCSFPENDADQHAYKYDFTKEEPVIVHIGNKKYHTTPGFMIQLRSFITYITLSKNIEVSVYGDSLVSAVCHWNPSCQI